MKIIFNFKSRIATLAESKNKSFSATTLLLIILIQSSSYNQDISCRIFCKLQNSSLLYFHSWSVCLSLADRLWQRWDILLLQIWTILPRDKDELLALHKLLHTGFLEPLVPRLQSELCHLLSVLTAKRGSAPPQVFLIVSTDRHTGAKKLWLSWCQWGSCTFKQWGSAEHTAPAKQHVWTAILLITVL